MRANNYGLLICIATILVMSGCISVKHSSTKSGKKLYETFFVGEEGTQYYIKPIALKSNDGEARMDITFRYKDQIKDSATVNISFVDDEVLKIADSIILTTPSNRIKLKVKNHMFSEKLKHGYLSRFSTKSSVAELKSAFDSNEWKLTLYSPIKTNVYTAPKKTKKIIGKLREVIFAVM